MERTLKERIELEEKQKETINDIEKKIRNWQNYSLEEQNKFLSSLRFDLTLLPDISQEIIINEISKAGICKKGQLRKEIRSAKNLWSSIERETEDKDRDKKGKREKTKTLIPGLIHLVKDGETVKYLIQNEGKLHIKDTYTLDDGTVCRPKQDLPIYMCDPSILEESRELDYEALLDTVIGFIKSYLELPSEKDYLILGTWVFHSYLIEKFDSTPIIYFYGVKETGKTRAGEVLQELAFRCERLTSPTEATLFRAADCFKTSLVIDEVKLWGKEGNQDVARLIKSRYKRGLKVPRINQNKKGREDQIEYFDVYGPLVIATIEPIPADIENRCIKLLMQRNINPKVEEFIDKDLAMRIRDKLIIFRTIFFDKELKKVGPISRRRLNEILSPLYQTLMTVAPGRENDFKLIVKDLEESKEIEEEFTLEAEIVECVVAQYNETGETSFLTSEIANRFNEDREDKDKLKISTIGRIITRMGFKKKRLRESGKRGFQFNLDFLGNLILQYRIKKVKFEKKLF